MYNSFSLFLDAAAPAAVLTASESDPQSPSDAAPAAFGKAQCFRIRYVGIFFKVWLHFSCSVKLLKAEIVQQFSLELYQSMIVLQSLYLFSQKSINKYFVFRYCHFSSRFFSDLFMDHNVYIQILRFFCLNNITIYLCLKIIYFEFLLL